MPGTRLLLRLACVTELVLALVGCPGKTADLGGEDAGLGHEGGTTQVDAESNSLSGMYEGHIESFLFPDGTDAIWMSLTFATGGAVTGSVYFGGTVEAPLATDPSVGYPPGYYDSPSSQNPPFEGFDFTVLGGTYASPPRLQLSIQQTEFWKRWCEIQTLIYPVDNGDVTPDGGCGTFLGYGCLPNGATQGGGGSSCAISSCEQPAWTPVDCGKLQLCRAGAGVCTCTASMCTVPLSAPGNVVFDMQYASGVLEGSVTGLGDNAQVYKVHLTKQ